jgi:negative regulator of sigma-B (phosphoserine phosphatase)
MKAAELEWSIAAATMPGETESGDRYWAGVVSNGMVFAVIDGLGHGPAAAAAAGIAIATLDQHIGDPVTQLLHHCHEALRRSRGVTMSLAAFNTEDAMLTWIGVGNVECALLHREVGLPCDKLLLCNGVVGVRSPGPRAEELPVRPGDILTMVTDGVTAERAICISMQGRLEAMAEGILADGSKGTDDALVLVARYRGARP